MKGVFVEPQNKITVEKIKTIFRNHYSPGDAPYHTKNVKVNLNRPIAVPRCQVSHITQLRGDLPSDIGNVDYIAYGFTDLSVFIPFYQGLGENIPESYKNATDKISDDSVYWLQRKLEILVFQNYSKYAPAVKEKIAKLEEKIKQDQKQIKSEYLKYYNKQEYKAARQCIVKHTHKWVSWQKAFLKRQIARLNSIYKFDDKKFMSEIYRINKVDFKLQFDPI